VPCRKVRLDSDAEIFDDEVMRAFDEHVLVGSVSGKETGEVIRSENLAGGQRHQDFFLVIIEIW
jgi:hypothetical protein